MDMNQVARNLTMYRKKNNLTQMELAEKINYSDKVISKWERGDSLPGIEALDILSTLYKVTIDDLIKNDLVDNNVDFKLNIEYTNKPSIFIKYSILIPIVFFIISVIFLFATMWLVYSLLILVVYLIVYSFLVSYVTAETSYKGNKIKVVNKPTSFNLYINDKLVDSNTNLLSFGTRLTGKAGDKTVKVSASFNFQFKCQIFIE